MDDNELGGCLGFILLAALAIGAWAVQAKFEADAYHRATGHRVSQWDAMFLDLRVQAEPKQ
jgi:hypothetical protein